MDTGSLIIHLVCHQCGKTYDPSIVQTYCQHDNEPLVAEYDLAKGLSKEVLDNRPSDMWRYREVLPIRKVSNIISLGEGMSPILSLNRLNKKLDIEQVLLKDEGLNPVYKKLRTKFNKPRDKCFILENADNISRYFGKNLPLLKGESLEICDTCRKGGIPKFYRKFFRNFFRNSRDLFISKPN